MELTTEQAMVLANIASKAAEHQQAFYEGLMRAGQTVEAVQVQSAIAEVVSVLGQLDEAYPGLLPVPHDGKTWKERAAAQEG